MTILITGSLGKTGLQLAKILTSEDHKVLIASRSGSAANYPAVKFDWAEPSTWKAAFETSEAKSSPITAIYLVVMLEGPDVLQTVRNFVELARSYVVKRFVFLSASTIDEHGSNWRSQVHAFLKQSDLEWAVLRPPKFMQNFSEQGVQPVKTQSIIVSATGDGKMPFVDTEDIAAVAAKALTSEKSLNKDVLVLGPELLSYDDVASILSSVTGRRITHKKYETEEFHQYLLSNGVPEPLASMLPHMEAAIKEGSENWLTDDVAPIIGRQPRTFREFAEKAKAQF